MKTNKQTNKLGRGNSSYKDTRISAHLGFENWKNNMAGLGVAERGVRLVRAIVWIRLCMKKPVSLKFF